MTASVPPASNNLSEVVANLRQLCRVDVQSGWKYCDSNSAVDFVNICNWPVAELNSKGHIAWPSGKQVLYLGQLFVIPHNLHGYPVADLRLLLGLTWWAEDAEIFVNGESVGRGDLFDCSDRVLLANSATEGDEFLVVLRLVSPSHDCGALVRSVCLYEAADSACLDPGFVADELEILQNFLTGNLPSLKLTHPPNEIVANRPPSVKREVLESEVFRQVGLIDWSALSEREKFDRSLSVLRQNLLLYLQGFPEDLEEGTAEGAEGAERGENYSAFGIGEGGEKSSKFTGLKLPPENLAVNCQLSTVNCLPTSIYIGEGGEKSSKFTGLKLPPENLAVNCQLSTVNCLTTSIYTGKINLLGHAHLDLAWLWPIEETWSAAERTFESVLKLQAEFPELIFCHSTPALYAWIEEHRPDLFAAIKKQVAAGRWEVVGGMWVEPDLNLISAESMVRQVFYGQRYAQEKFGELMRVVWLPDTFGFGWQLPQILRDGGIDYFVTQKLRWNDTTEFPHGVFWWEGLDGTKIFSMMSAAIGEGIESVKMANYTFDWEAKTGLQAALWLPGVGDHGGGPTRDMLEVAQRWQKSPFFPSLQFAKAVDYLSAIESQFLPEVSEFQSIVDVSNPENKSILKQSEAADNLRKAESDNFNEISDFESIVDVSNPENKPILKVEEVADNLRKAESDNFGEISDFESIVDVSNRENPPILKVEEVADNLRKAESDNFNEISDFESQVDVSNPENKSILKQSEAADNLRKAESDNFNEISDFESQVDVSNPENKSILKQSEAADNLRKAESDNLNEISDFESIVDVSNRENPPILKVEEVADNLRKAESDNFGEISDFESQVDVSNPENKSILKQSEAADNLRKAESDNLNEVSDFESIVDVSNRENPPILKVEEVADNLRKAESDNFGEISDFESQADVSNPENKSILKVEEVADNLRKAESDNLNEVSDFESIVDVSNRENPPILKVEEVADNLRKAESDKLPEVSDFQSIVDAATLPSLPIWKDEIYLEFHRGCYTTRADQKRQNRRCEELLYQAELLSSVATICAGAIYPGAELETAWKKVLFNQFHDILPGSAIAQVYIDANLAFAEVDRTCNQIVAKSLLSIATRISLPKPPQPDAQPILIFNTLNWSRSQLVTLPLPDSTAAETWFVCDLEGQRLAAQISQVDRPQPQFILLFSANNIPAVGYRLFWLCREQPQTLENPLLSPQNQLQTDLVQVTNKITPKLAVCQQTHFEASRNVLENEFFRATIDIETGNLSSIWDKANHREVLNPSGGNQLQAFADSGQYWDAWNIDPNYQKHQLPPPILKDICWLEQGELRQILRVVRQIGKSEFCQDYIVEINSPLLKIKTVVDWQETHVLVKTAFGLNQSADFATCEIPGGAIERTTKPQTATEKAKWEVPILRWTDISNDDFGVSLLNDCKYGCDIQPNQLRLTLLRGSTWPDEQADLGIHEFTYAVYPHSGNWQKADTVRQGYELNLPLLVKVLPKLDENPNKTLPAVGKLLDLSAENLVLMAFKQSEENQNVWILRCYECHGQEANLELKSDLGLAISQPVDLLEQPLNLRENSDGISFQISPWKIASFAVNLL